MIKYLIPIITIVSLIILAIGIYFFVKKEKEQFSFPNFIVILPKSNEAPATVEFNSIYVNENSPYVIDFGDGSPKMNVPNNDIYEHIYQKPGTYNGIISFDNTCVTQKFQITIV